MRRQQQKIITQLETITPIMAEELLAGNTGNRRIRNGHVDSLALLMQSGLWRADNNDAILIDTEGKVINGQHRLNAVIKAGIPVTMPIRYDVDPEMYKYLDQGMKRSTEDFLSHPIANQAQIVSIARVITALKHGSVTLSSALHGTIASTEKVPNEWVIREVEDNEDLYQETVRSAVRMRTILRRASLSTIGAFIMIIRYVGRDDALDDYVADFTALQSSESAVIAARNYITQQMLSGKKLNKTELMGVLLYSYEKLRRGQILQRIQKGAVQAVYDDYETLALDKFKKKTGDRT